MSYLLFNSIGSYESVQTRPPNSISDLNLPTPLQTITLTTSTQITNTLNTGAGLSKPLDSTLGVQTVQITGTGNDPFNYGGALNTAPTQYTSLKSKTILINMMTTQRGEFIFGTNTADKNGLCMTIDATPNRSCGIHYTVDYARASGSSNMGPSLPAVVANTTAASGVWYTFIISIDANGSVKWAFQRIGDANFVNNTIYSYTDNAVNSNVAFALVGDVGPTSYYSRFSSIRVYNGALLHGY